MGSPVSSGTTSRGDIKGRRAADNSSMDGDRAVYLLALGASLLALTACAALESEEDKPFFGEDEIRYGPASKPATVDCEESDALDELPDYDFGRAWSCEIVFKDGSGRTAICWTRGGPPVPMNSTCEQAAEQLRRASR